MPNSEKIQKVKDISQKVEKASSITFFEYKTLGANALNDLRNKVKGATAEVLIAKNTLVKIALGHKKAHDSDLHGQTGVLFSFGDSISPLKILSDFSKKFEGLKIKGAFIDGSYYEAKKVIEIGQLPSRLEIVAKILSGFKSPISNIVYALSAIAKKREVSE